MDIINQIQEELIKRCKSYEEKTGYNYWEDHIKHVVKNAIELAKQYGANVEIVTLGALLHDIAAPAEYGSIEEHHIYGAKIADELLHKLNYPEEKIELVKQCIENHRSSRKAERNTVEEQCVADADAIEHFDAIPSLFSLAYKDRKMNIQAGANFVKEKLKRDYQKLSPKTKELMQARYKNIMKEVFLEE